MASLLDFIKGLFGRGGGGKPGDRIPLVYGEPQPNIPTVFGPDYTPDTYGTAAVVSGVGDTPMNALRANGLAPNIWYAPASTAIAGMMFQAYGDQAGKGNVWVRFRGGSKRYNYPNVPAQEFVNFYNASSKGRFVHNVLRPLYSVGRGRHWRAAGRPAQFRL